VIIMNAKSLMLIFAYIAKVSQKTFLTMIKNNNNNATNEDLVMNQIVDIHAFFGLNNRIPAQIIRMRK
jgi:hypothetical protein